MDNLTRLIEKLFVPIARKAFQEQVTESDFQWIFRAFAYYHDRSNLHTAGESTDRALSELCAGGPFKGNIRLCA